MLYWIPICLDIIYLVSLNLNSLTAEVKQGIPCIHYPYLRLLRTLHEESLDESL